jgi:hypothetical protein
LKIFGGQISFERARETISLSDGAKWIYSQVCAALLSLGAIPLDFYHLSQHVYQAAGQCLGDQSEATSQWTLARLTEIKTLGPGPVLAEIEALGKKLKSPAKKKSPRALREYILTRLEMVDYRQALARGWDIGSGPTEALGKSLRLRLKRPGMKWDPGHAAGVMNLLALFESGQAQDYWKHRATHQKAA